MANGKATVNGLKERVSGLEVLMNEKFKGVADDIGEIKCDLKTLRTNELEHLKADIDSLKKFQWKLIGGIGVLWALIQAVFKYVLPILK